LRKVETTSAAHAVDFTTVAVSQFLICWHKRLMSTVLCQIKFALWKKPISQLTLRVRKILAVKVEVKLRYS